MNIIKINVRLLLPMLSSVVMSRRQQLFDSESRQILLEDEDNDCLTEESATLKDDKRYELPPEDE